MISKKLQCRIQSLESTYVQKVKRQLDIEKKHRYFFYGGILSCKINYVNMQQNYVNMQLIYINMQIIMSTCNII